MDNTSIFPDGTYRDLDPEQLIYLYQNFAQAKNTQSAEIWYEAKEDEFLVVLINGDRATLMYLENDEDSGIYSYDLTYVGAEEATLDFTLNNGEINQIPVSWTLPASNVILAVEYFLQTGAIPSWITWMVQ